MKRQKQIDQHSSPADVLVRDVRHVLNRIAHVSPQCSFLLDRVCRKICWFTKNEINYREARRALEQMFPLHDSPEGPVVIGIYLTGR